MTSQALRCCAAPTSKVFYCVTKTEYKMYFNIEMVKKMMIARRRLTKSMWCRRFYLSSDIVPPTKGPFPFLWSLIIKRCSVRYRNALLSSNHLQHRMTSDTWLHFSMISLACPPNGRNNLRLSVWCLPFNTAWKGSEGSLWNLYYRQVFDNNDY